ncbi:unnamed protein product [Chrysodeixis includens]|uniref:Insulin-like domain-containing protein n=1 Tax=Chrysodeixis includens TaxID=689277 RepID=A0A9N8PYE7_CHRIL|nr:unnamed protein product [Chrysodeixis includens]
MQFSVSVLLLSVALVCSAQIEMDSKTTNRTYCGRTLYYARALFCYGLEDVHDNSTNTKSTWPSISGQQALTLSPVSRERRAGLTSECCTKPCSPSEIIQYC